MVHLWTRVFYSGDATFVPSDIECSLLQQCSRLVLLVGQLLLAVSPE